MSDWICRYCGKKLGEINKHGVKAMKNRAKSYDSYYFCKEGDCLKIYFDNGEKSKEELKGVLE